jgi:hypothetical protein
LLGFAPKPRLVLIALEARKRARKFRALFLVSEGRSTLLAALLIHIVLAGFSGLLARLLA